MLLMSWRVWRIGNKTCKLNWTKWWIGNENFVLGVPIKWLPSLLGRRCKRRPARLARMFRFRCAQRCRCCATASPCRPTRAAYHIFWKIYIYVCSLFYFCSNALTMNQVLPLQISPLPAHPTLISAGWRSCSIMLLMSWKVFVLLLLNSRIGNITRKLNWTKWWSGSENFVL